MKTDKEIFEYWEKKDYESLNTQELQRLKTLLELKEFEEVHVEIPTEPDIAKPESSPNATNDFNDYQWIINAGTKAYEHNFTDADANCPTDYSNWTPSEYFSNYILHCVAADTPLLDLVKMKVDVSAGNGDDVKFRRISARTAQAVASCECMSCASNTLYTHNVKIARFGDYTELCQFELWQSKDVKKEVARSMAKGASRYVNSEIHDAITEASITYNVDMASCFTGCGADIAGSCCSDINGYNFYTAAVDLIADMVAGGYNDIYEQGCWLIHPDVAAFLKYPSSLDVPYWMRGSTDIKDGKLVKLCGIEVREDPLGQACSTATNTVFAYLIHKKRSIGLAWGQKPNFNFEYDGICDSWEITYNAYFGVDSIEDASIGTISSPDS